jgi:hypothetical protein
MRFELQDYHRDITDSELIADLQRIAGELGKSSITIDEYNERGKYHNTTLSRRFGGWFKALEEAGLSRTRNLHITDEEYFENIQEVWLKLGRQPRYQEMHKPLSKYSAGAYEYRFGKWRTALEKFVRYVNKEVVISSSSKRAKHTKSSTPSKLLRHFTKRSINWRLRFRVMQRDNFKCVKCGRSPATDPSVVLQVDHTLPWNKGGETVIENLQTLCSICNIGKSDSLEN